MIIKRYLENNILKDLSEKMVFISGPRQVGKTTLVKNIGNNYFKGEFSYLNWDNRDDRKNILSSMYRADKKLVIFDELHKYKKWKSHLKGEYDKYREDFKIIVTGSARMDIYRKGGDSLLGRYHSYRLHPLTLSELIKTTKKTKPFEKLSFIKTNEDAHRLLNDLFVFGGFPEVFLKKNERFLRRWHNERVDRLIKEDIRDIETLRDISSIQILVDILPIKVGSVFSLNSLREDLGVTHKTVSLWVDILEKFYYHFRIHPFQSKKIQSLRKEPKMYLWDWSELKNDSAKFENLIASHLLKFCHYLYDYEGYKIDLCYLRDKEQREVDFLVTIDNKPWFCVEAKSSFNGIPSNLKYFINRLQIPYSYLVTKDDGYDHIKDNIHIISASKFLTGLL
ncbi:MAG TPA: AAA family ATPase [Elusimicrobia bacterium]|nr:AAA family ATPase [Elusimicrobiota bacterium]